MTAKPTLNTLAEDLATGMQDVTYTRTLKASQDGKAFKLRVEVKSDSYPAQCYARVKVWNGDTLTWNFVDSIAPSNMSTPDSLCYVPESRKPTTKTFSKDADALIARALAILV